MTGLERNSDLVIMASYAPLFVNVNPGGMQWATDLIGYDALASYGSPSYWTQVMFASHVGTQILPATFTGAGPRLFASATRDPSHHKIFIKVVNANSTPQPLAIDLEGVAKPRRGPRSSPSAAKPPTPPTASPIHARLCPSSNPSPSPDPDSRAPSRPGQSM